MAKLHQVDKLVVDVLMDNQSDNYSSKPAHVTGEFQNIVNAGACEISGNTLCCAQLGLSLMLTAYSGNVRHKLLFDAGPEGDLLVRNCKSLGVDLTDVEEVAISHGHWDHMGALLAMLKEITVNDRRVKCHVNPDMFVERGARLSDGSVTPFEKVPTPEMLSQQGADVVNDYSERKILEDFFYISAEIPRVTKFEKGRIDHLSRHSEKQEWQPDPLLIDERYLAVHLREKGMIIFSSCSHAGIINVLHDVKSKFKDVPIYCIFGGLHLVGSLEQIIPVTIEQLKTFKPSQIVPAHCTGWRAAVALVNAFGEDVVVPSAVGSKYTFQ